MAGPQCLDTVLSGAKLAGLPMSSVYLINLERGPLRGVRTLGDLMSHGEMEWAKIEDEATMKRR